MRWMPTLLVLAVLCCLTPLAKADDFQMVVIDPQPSPVSFYLITTPGEQIDASWGSCIPGELPPGSPSYQGCIAFLNVSGTTLQSFQIVVPDSGGVSGQTASCPSDPNDVFSNLSCDPNPVGGSWVLDFTGGDIPTLFCHNDLIPCAGSFFVLGENGADPSAFPESTVVPYDTPEIPGTPEPAPALLLSTGLLMSGLFYGNRRRLLAAQRQ